MAPRGNFTWLVRELLATSVPNRYLKTIAAVAIDSTANPTWARTREYRLEKDLLAEHRLESLKEPDLPKPAENPEGKVRTVGSDGRFIRSYDIDARPGYKSATNKEPASLFLGYDAHIAVAVAEAVWSGNPNHVAIKPARRDIFSLSTSLREPPIPDPSDCNSPSNLTRSHQASATLSPIVPTPTNDSRS